jgi:hypothetical protein
MGEVIDVFEERRNEAGQLRVRFAAGWTSVTASDGQVLLEIVPDEEQPHLVLCFARDGAQVIGNDTSFLWEVGVCNGTDLLIVPLAQDPLAQDVTTTTTIRRQSLWFWPLVVFVSQFILFETGLCAIDQCMHRFTVTGNNLGPLGILMQAFLAGYLLITCSQRTFGCSERAESQSIYAGL